MNAKYFDSEFFPTPDNVIDIMLDGEGVENMVVLEPSAGKGDIVSRLYAAGATVIACEKDNELRSILTNKGDCKVIANDFFTVTSDMVSHIHYIIMNPPFSNADKHILHAYHIAPAGCKIIALCNSSTLSCAYSEQRKELSALLESYGQVENLGECFDQAQRKTYVNVSLLRLQKPADNYEQEFNGFFLDEEVEPETGPGLMSYNVVRDIVNRYVEAVKIYDQQLETAVRLNDMTGMFNVDKMELSVFVSRGGVPVARSNFKKELQKAGWKWIFEKMNLNKYSTKGLKEDINKFVETQTEIPFTMRNIYKMLEIVVGTTGQRMDKAILEVFDNVTKHSSDNRYDVEGWKTNSHYMLNKKFIMNCIVGADYGGSGRVSTYSWSNGNFQTVEDLVKALCFVTGENYSDHVSLEDFIRYRYFLKKDGKFVNDPAYTYDLKVKGNKVDEWDGVAKKKESIYGSEIFERKLEWGQWTDWGFFRIKPYKKGTMHFEFKKEEVWAAFNQRVAKLKGFVIPEKKEKTKYQKRQAGEDKQKYGYVKKVFA